MVCSPTLLFLQKKPSWIVLALTEFNLCFSFIWNLRRVPANLGVKYSIRYIYLRIVLYPELHSCNTVSGADKILMFFKLVAGW